MSRILRRLAKGWAFDGLTDLGARSLGLGSFKNSGDNFFVLRWCIVCLCYLNLLYDLYGLSGHLPEFLACSPLLALAVSWGRISVSKWFMMCLEKLGTALRLWRVQLMFLRFPKATGSCGGSSIRGTRESEARACGAHGAHGAHGARINGSNGPRAGVATREGPAGAESSRASQRGENSEKDRASWRK